VAHLKPHSGRFVSHAGAALMEAGALLLVSTDIIPGIAPLFAGSGGAVIGWHWMSATATRITFQVVK
jgi:hypothetical protein